MLTCPELRKALFCKVAQLPGWSTGFLSGVPFSCYIHCILCWHLTFNCTKQLRLASLLCQNISTDQVIMLYWLVSSGCKLECNYGGNSKIFVTQQECYLRITENVEIVFKGKMNAGTRAYVRFTVKYTNITRNQLAGSGIESFSGMSLYRILMKPKKEDKAIRREQKGESSALSTVISVIGNSTEVEKSLAGLYACMY